MVHETDEDPLDFKWTTADSVAAFFGVHSDFNKYMADAKNDPAVNYDPEAMVEYAKNRVENDRLKAAGVVNSWPPYTPK